MAVRAFVCGSVSGIAVAQVAILGGGPTTAAALVALGVGALVVMILRVHIGGIRRGKDELAAML